MRQVMMEAKSDKGRGGALESGSGAMFGDVK